jgi:hypothetical protein
MAFWQDMIEGAKDPFTILELVGFILFIGFIVYGAWWLWLNYGD